MTHIIWQLDRKKELHDAVACARVTISQSYTPIHTVGVQKPLFHVEKSPPEASMRAAPLLLGRRQLAKARRCVPLSSPRPGLAGWSCGSPAAHPGPSTCPLGTSSMHAPACHCCILSTQRHTSGKGSPEARETMAAAHLHIPLTYHAQFALEILKTHALLCLHLSAGRRPARRERCQDGKDRVPVRRRRSGLLTSSSYWSFWGLL